MAADQEAEGLLDQIMRSCHYTNLNLRTKLTILNATRHPDSRAEDERIAGEDQ